MARPRKLHFMNHAPWTVPKYAWERAAQYRDNPPAFWTDWLSPLIPLDSDSTVGAKTRCGYELPIDRFAPTSGTVSCDRCITLVMMFSDLPSDIPPREILPETLQYLDYCMHCGRERTNGLCRQCDIVDRDDDCDY